MGILNKTKCYLAGAMEYENGEVWRNNAEQSLISLGIKCLNPYKKPFILKNNEDDESRKLLRKWMIDGDFDRVSSYMKSVRNDDLRCCDLVDFAICYINPTIPSWGTAEEITTLNREKKPIFIIIEGGKNKCPLWIMGMINHKYIYNSLEDVLEMIKKIDNLSVEIDSERWQLLEMSYR